MSFYIMQMCSSLRTIFYLGGPSDHTGSHGNWLNGCKIVLITYPNPCIGYSFPLVFPNFFTFLLIFMNIQKI